MPSKLSDPQVQKVHKVYETLLALLPLDKDHAAALNTRGFTPRECRSLGYTTLPVSRREAIAKLLQGCDPIGVPGFWRDDQGNVQLAGKSGILIPIRDAAGLIRALKIRVDKPSSPSAKYLLLSSNPKADKKSGEVKYPHGASAPLTVHYPKDQPKKVKVLRITEGELKADIATMMLPEYTVSLPGVTAWRMGLEVVRELKPERVLLSFDSDKVKPLNNEGVDDLAYGKPKGEEGEGFSTNAPTQDDFAVGKALASLYLALREEGVSVGIEDWPAEAGKGIDDVIMNGHTDKLRVLSDDEAREFADEMLTADLPDGWVYVVGVKRFYHTRTLLELDKEQFADRYAHETKGNPATKALANPAFPKVDLPIYTPAREMRYDEENVRYFNTWRANSLRPTKGEVKLFLAHMEYLFPDEKERNIVLDWMAWQVQRPGEKVHWALLIQGVQGTGKSFIGKVMRLLLGEANVSMPTNEAIHEPYTAWQKSCQLVIVEELMARGRLELMNKLKPIITQEVTLIREMNKPFYYQPNTFNMLMFTNHEDAVILDKTDRRYCVVFSPAEPQAPAYYEKLWEWTEGHAGRLLNYFLARDVSSFLPKAHAPMTRGKLELIGLSTPPLQAWIAEGVEEEKWPFMADLVSTTHLIEILPPSLRNSTTPQSLSRALKATGAMQLPQIPLKNGARVRLWSVRRHEIWEGAERETLQAEYQKWTEGAQPGGSPDAVNPLRDSRPM